VEALIVKNSQEALPEKCNLVGPGGGAMREPLSLRVNLGGTTMTSSHDVIVFCFFEKDKGGVK